MISYLTEKNVTSTTNTAKKESKAVAERTLKEWMIFSICLWVAKEDLVGQRKRRLRLNRLSSKLRLVWLMCTMEKKSKSTVTDKESAVRVMASVELTQLLCKSVPAAKEEG
jgi:hypothetical protein